MSEGKKPVQLVLPVGEYQELKEIAKMYNDTYVGTVRRGLKLLRTLSAHTSTGDKVFIQRLNREDLTEIIIL